MRTMDEVLQEGARRLIAARGDGAGLWERWSARDRAWRALLDTLAHTLPGPLLEALPGLAPDWFEATADLLRTGAVANDCEIRVPVCTGTLSTYVRWERDRWVQRAAFQREGRSYIWAGLDERGEVVSCSNDAAVVAATLAALEGGYRGRNTAGQALGLSPRVLSAAERRLQDAFSAWHLAGPDDRHPRWAEVLDALEEWMHGSVEFVPEDGDPNDAQAVADGCVSDIDF